MADLELLDWIFALRLELSSRYIAEKDIIYELKYYLRDNKGIYGEECNLLLKQFYSSFNIPLSDNFIKSINIPNNIVNNTENKIDDNIDSDEENKIDDNIDSDEETEEEIPPYVSNNNTIYNPLTNQIHFIVNDSNLNTVLPSLPINMNTLLVDLINMYDISNVPTVAPTQNDVLVTCDKNDLVKLKEYQFKIHNDKPNTPNEILACSICKTDFEETEKIIETPCKHVFHSECITIWLKNKSNKCPNCRKECGKAFAHI